MPSCPECGIDVPVEGLCLECKSRQEKEQREEKKDGKSNRTLIAIGIPVITVAAAVVVLFLVLSNRALSESISLNSEESGLKSAESRQQEADESENSEIVVDTTEESEEETEEIEEETGEIQKETGEQVSEEPEPVYDIKSRANGPEEGPPIDSKDNYIKWMMEFTDHEEKFLSQRWDRAQYAMVQFNPPDLTHERVIKAFLRTPREYFCREWNLDNAYIHNFLGIGYGVTISGPHIVARMTDNINPMPDHKVLEIGTGSGYQSAFLAELSNWVFTIEIIEPLAVETDAIYKNLEKKYSQYKNIRRQTADGYYGWESEAPFDRIIVTCSIDHIPPPLLKQLAPEGMMIIPVGPPGAQELLVITKHIEEDGTVTLDRRSVYEEVTGRGGLTTVNFVPFTAEKGNETHSKKRDMPTESQ